MFALTYAYTEHALYMAESGNRLPDWGGVLCMLSRPRRTGPRAQWAYTVLLSSCAENTLNPFSATLFLIVAK